MKQILLPFLFLILFSAGAWAQDEPTEGSPSSDSSKYTFLSASTLCSVYQVDGRLIDDADMLLSVMDSLQKVQPNAFPLMSQWCTQQRGRMLRMSSSLLEEYNFDGAVAWIDSTHCIIDASLYAAKLTQMASTLEARSEYYNKKEQERLEEERRAAEERARAEALRIQREKDQRLARLQDSVKNQHMSITVSCDGSGESDKNRVKILKDIYYAYLSIYNRYDITSQATDDSHFAQLNELREFQSELMDSVIGPYSYIKQSDRLKESIRVRSGKNHSDVNKSYTKIFKKVQVPVSFKSIAEYRTYLGELRELRNVQLQYLAVIDYLDSMDHYNNIIQSRCGKQHRDIYNAEKEILATLSTTPEFTNTQQGTIFVADLANFVVVQRRYLAVIDRIEVIDRRGDSIVTACDKQFGDVASSYRELKEATDFVPKMRNLNDAEFFNRQLDVFETIQGIFQEIITLRSMITSKGDTILSSKSTPKGIINGYKLVLKSTDFKPAFTDESGGVAHKQLLKNFINIQNKFITIGNNTDLINRNSLQFKTAFKDYSNIYKAYERLLKIYDYEINILTEADVDSYLRHQNNVLRMQNRFIEVMNSTEKVDLNKRLKREKDPNNIKLIMGIE